MNYRVAKILAEKTLTGSGTEPISIKIKDVISRITIASRVSKSKHAMDSFPYANITKIELKDGSDTLFGMEGGECQALNIYDRKCPTMNHGQEMTNLSEYATFGLDFGRKLFDRELAFDPTKFTNPQLEISYDVDVSDTGVSSLYLEIWADCFDERMVTPVGFLMSKEHWSGAKPTSGYEYIDLPTDYPIRKMLLKAYVKGAEPWYQIIAARIDEDNEKRIPFDWDDLEDYARVMKGIWTPVEEQLVAQPGASGAIYYFTPTDYYTSVLLMASNIQSYGYSTDSWFKGGKITLKGDGGNNQMVGVVRGYLPNHCFEFPFGDQDDMVDWYDVTRLGSCRLRLKAGTGASTTTGVVLQQLRRY